MTKSMLSFLGIPGSRTSSGSGLTCAYCMYWKHNTCRHKKHENTDIARVCSLYRYRSAATSGLDEDGQLRLSISRLCKPDRQRLTATIINNMIAQNLDVYDLAERMHTDFEKIDGQLSCRDEVSPNLLIRAAEVLGIETNSLVA